MAAGAIVPNPKSMYTRAPAGPAGRLRVLVGAVYTNEVGKRPQFHTFRDIAPLNIVNLEGRSLYGALGKLNAHRKPPRRQEGPTPNAKLTRNEETKPPQRRDDRSKRRAQGHNGEKRSDRGAAGESLLQELGRGRCGLWYPPSGCDGI